MQPEGVIIGGWNYVIAAYAVTAVVLAAYAWSVRSRLSKLQSRNRQPVREPGEPTNG
jgi:CcmD family protein